MADTFTDAIEAGASNRPSFSQEGLDLVRTFEGFRPEAYYDLDNKKKKGKLTVGYGFTNFDIPDLKPGYKIDKARAEQMLPDLIENKYGSAVLEKVKAPLNSQQYSALASFVYNVGPTAFDNSTMLKKLNAGDFSGAASEFKKWNKAGGKTLEGLTKRRRAEEALFRGDTDSLGSILESQRFGLPETGASRTEMSEAVTPMPDAPSESPEEVGAGVAKRIAAEMEMTPEERGVNAAKRVAESIENAASKPVESSAGNKFDLESFTKLLSGPQKKGDEESIPFADSVSFSGNIPRVPSGLPRNSGLGRMG